MKEGYSFCLLLHHLILTKGSFSHEDTCSVVWLEALEDLLTVDVSQLIWLVI